MGYEGKTAVVTGGAAGIGEAVVRGFVKAGGSAVFVDIDEERGSALAADLSSTDRCLFVPGSVRDEAVSARTVTAAEERFGLVSVLVNNAVRAIFRSIEATSAEWQDILGVNITGASIMTRYAVESMKKAGGGSIVNIGSISGFIAQAGTMTYNTTKAALLGMTRCLALDLGKYNIRANCICPGYTKTAGYYYYVDQSGRSREEVEKELSAETMLGRLATPEDIAGCVLFLCSPEAAYVTGTFLLVDGGLTAL
jgi:NAD(P)-dependent dehydrogenase (short-subunit alcohol dehydrogenase family)